MGKGNIRIKRTAANTSARVAISLGPAPDCTGYAAANETSGGKEQKHILAERDDQIFRSML